METHGIIRYRTLLSTLAVVVLLVFAGASAQTPAGESNAQPGTQQPNTGSQERVPADHYDPDDTKTYDDVITEDREVAVRGRQFTVHFYRPGIAGAAVP